MFSVIPDQERPIVARSFWLAQRSDESLMGAVARGDRFALEALYNRYSRLALGLAFRVVGDRLSGEEIVQEAFWRVWNRANTFRPKRGRFKPWLEGIVRNLAVDELRHRSARPQTFSVELYDVDYGMPGCESDVAATAYSALTGERVRAAMAWLSPDQRQVVELAYFQGMTHKEIALALKQPLGTVHTRARMAIERLRRELANSFAF